MCGPMGRVGTDIVSVARVTGLLGRSGAEGLARWFTPAELDYCLAKAVPGRHLAARLAAKEAVAKALSWRWEAELPWRDIEITHDDRGAPRVRLSGGTARLAAEAGTAAVEVSLSHCDEFATATAIAVPAAGPAAGPAAAPDSRAADRERRLDAIARELPHLPPREDDPHLAALRVAVLVEDCLDIVLTDEELDDPALAADPVAFVRARSRS